MRLFEALNGTTCHLSALMRSTRATNQSLDSKHFFLLLCEIASAWLWSGDLAGSHDFLLTLTIACRYHLTRFIIVFATTEQQLGWSGQWWTAFLPHERFWLAKTQAQWCLNPQTDTIGGQLCTEEDLVSDFKSTLIYCLWPKISRLQQCRLDGTRD